MRNFLASILSFNSPPDSGTQKPRSGLRPPHFIILLVVVLIGITLRLYALDDIFLWQDETANFDEEIYNNMTTTFRRYVASEAQTLTVGPAYSTIIALTSRIFGGTVKVGRMPSVFFGAATILAVFFLVYRVIQDDSRNSPFTLAIFAASLTAISIVQIKFSQFLIPYAAVPFLTTILIILHLTIINVIENNKISLDKFAILAFLYALVAGFSIYLHMSLTIVLFGSFLIFLPLVRRFFELNRENKVIALGISSLVFLAVFLAFIGNAIHSQSPTRGYLAPYYHRLDLGAIPFLLSRAYDLLTYHLTLFYNGALYWPFKLNPVLLPLVVLCVFGWCRAAVGKYGRTARNLSLLAAICLFLPAILSLFRKYPFGGVRQTLFMTPFLFSFTALGFHTIARSRLGKILGCILASAYIVLWGVSLPHFYRDRITPFNSEELVTVWRQSGKLKFYAIGACEDSIKYRLRQHPEIHVENLSASLPDEQSYLLISTRWAIEDSAWRPSLQEEIRGFGYQANLLIIRSPKYPITSNQFRSLYWPPNGLWIYRITSNELHE